MDWFKKHTDAVIVISVILATTLWMNTRFNEIDKQFSDLDKEIAVIKTVLIMKEILPKELCAKD